MVESCYKFKATYIVINFDTTSASLVDNAIKKLKKMLMDELMHCIYPLSCPLSVSAEISEHNDLEVTIHSPKIITEDSIDVEKFSTHLKTKFSKLPISGDCVCYLQELKLIALKSK